MLTDFERELISAGIDGELSPDDERAHAALLERSAAARALRDELLKIGDLIEGLPERTPPADLSERILERLTPAPRVVPIRSFWRRTQITLAFAAGLLAAVAIQRWLPTTVAPDEQARMSGTLAPLDRVVAVDTRIIDEAGLRGRVTFGRARGVPSLTFALQATRPLEVEIDFGRAGFEFGGLAPESAARGLRGARVEISGGTVRVAGDGAAAFRLLLPAEDGAAPDALRVAIRSDGALRWQAAFAAEP